MKKCLVSLQMIIIFSLLAYYNVVHVESYRIFSRFDRDSGGLKSHVTSLDGLAAVDVETPMPPPSLVQPVVLSVTKTVGALVVPSRLSAESPLVVSSAEIGSPSGSSPNVLAIVICSLLLAGVIIGLIWFICAMSDPDCCDVEQSPTRAFASSVSPAPPVEYMLNTHPPVKNEKGVGEAKPSHPPAPPVVANARGEGGEDKPSNQPRPPMAFEFRGGGSKRTPPGPSIAYGLGGDGSRPAPPPGPSIVNGLGGDGSKPTPPPDSSKTNGVGGAGSKPTNVPVAPMVNGNGVDGSVAVQPSAPPVARRKSNAFRCSSLELRVRTDVINAPIELETRHPIRSTEPGESPPRLAEIGLIPFSYEELRDSTDGFSTANFLGEGGFAKVYKGSLTNGRKVAVKVLRSENSKAEKEFRNEVDIISRAKHRNIVSLVGYCITPTKRLIVYEFVENRSLHDHLRGGKDIQVMNWAVRMKIARGASKGLAYLHEECPQKIIHRDVKPANILLDFHFTPKVADFGIAKLCPEHFESLIATYAIGSMGFIDPAYVETKELSFKSDVYSFGVVLLMLISGQINLVIVQELKSKLSRALRSSNFHGIADERLTNKYDVDEMTRMVTCADACLRRDPKDRPDMSQISRVLENIVSVTDLKIKTRPRRSV